MTPQFKQSMVNLNLKFASLEKSINTHYGSHNSAIHLIRYQLPNEEVDSDSSEILLRTAECPQLPGIDSCFRYAGVNEECLLQ